MRTMLKQALALLLVVQLIWAKETPRIKTDWKGFQQQVARHKLGNRKALVSLITGETISTFFLNASDEGLVVQSDKNTRKWAMKEGNALVPRTIVSGVEFRGKIGRGGVIGGLTGLGAGAGAAAAAVSSARGNCEGVSCLGGLVLIPVLAIGGYFIGHAADKRAPSFIIEQ